MLSSTDATFVATRSSGRRRRAAVLAGAALSAWLVVGYPCWAQQPAPAAARPPLTAEQWREDLRFMAAEMQERHADLHHTVSREAFAKAVADVDARIPTLERNQIIVGMMRIAAMVGDGHTRVDPRKDPDFGFPSLPLKLYLFEDGLHVRAAAPKHADLLGARIDAVGGVPIAEALRRVGEISARDNAMGLKFYAPLFLNMPDVLHALGMAERRDTAVLTLSKGGRTWTAAVAAGAVEPLWPPDTDISLSTPVGWKDARTTPDLPLWLQAPLDYHRLIELPERKALYAQLNMVAHVKGQSLGDYGVKIRQRAEATNPSVVVLDLRLNHGGNGHLRNRLIRELIKAEDADTRLAVLTWRGTYSASQFILDDLDRLTDAVFIGEPASSKPSSFGDAYKTGLPNSGIDVRSAIYWWQAGQNRDPWTWTDIATPLTFADYAAGRDPALEAALSYKPGAPFEQRLAAAAQAGGPDEVRRVFKAHLADPANRYADIEQQAAAGAERLFNSGRRPEGLLAAELAAEAFPNSVDAANVLAHLAAAQQMPEVARRSARRVLELDPDNRWARSLLERLNK